MTAAASGQPEKRQYSPQYNGDRNMCAVDALIFVCCPRSPFFKHVFSGVVAPWLLCTSSMHATILDIGHLACMGRQSHDTTPTDWCTHADSVIISSTQITSRSEEWNTKSDMQANIMGMMTGARTCWIWRHGDQITDITAVTRFTIYEYTNEQLHTTDYTHERTRQMFHL